jgi:hypothetical protein
MATLALFVALGGASYAAVELPANSVGSAQLKRGAVTFRALGLPLGSTTTTDRKPYDIAKGVCNGGGRPGDTRVIHCPIDIPEPVPGSEAETALKAPGELLISAIVGLGENGPAAASARVAIALSVDGRRLAPVEATVTGGEASQVPVQALIQAEPGRHSVAVAARAEYSSYEAGDVVVSPVSLVVTTLPTPRPPRRDRCPKHSVCI